MLLHKKSTVMSKSKIAASILRNILISHLGCKAREISFGDIISPEWTGKCNLNVSYEDHEDTGDLQVKTWSPSAGFVDITDDVVNQTYFSQGNHKQTEYPAIPLHECVKGNELFIIIGNGEDEYLHYTIHKTPNFQSHWDKLEKEDILCWENFLA